ncbi:LamG domain-containing protein [Streptomyces sp. TS71-3]|uniref:LamG domain-containing protein n=1 Tax=Streptomyces sp. TS71-3 TaxID=2733862 RepID=UPI002016B2D2|nr:LamG domain-containing protein [Streptomyces sp. TS71-3]
MPAKSGVNFITAQSFDAAGNASAPTVYYFRVRAGQPERVRWGLDENAGATSVSGQGGSWPATLTTGAKAGAEGVSGGGLQLDGASGEAATVSPVLDTSKSFSVSAWAKLPGTSPGTSETLIAQSGNSSSGFEIYYSPASGGWVFERYLADTSTSVVRAVQPACTAGDTACTSERVSQWTHVVGVFDYANAALKLYVDGHLVATTPYTATPWDARRSLHLGAHSINGTVGSYFDGTLDQVALFDYQLNDAQVAQLHDQRDVDTGRPAKAVWSMDEDASATTVDGHAQKVSAALHGGTTLGGAGQDGTALALNGTDGYAQTGQPVLDTVQSYSVSFWAKLPTDKPDRPMTAISQDGTNQAGLVIYHSSAAGGWVFQRAGNDTSTAPITQAVDAACPAHTNCTDGHFGEWTHVVGVYDADASQLRLYVGGELKSQKSFTTPWLARGPVTLGASPTATGFRDVFQGGLDDVRMYDRALSEDEVRDLGLQHHPVIEGRWKLDDASGNPPTSAESVTGGRPLTLSGGASIATPGVVDSGALVLDGQNGYAFTASVPIDTSRSFTVTAWALAPSGRPTRTAAVLSQEGEVNSSFELAYDPGGDTDGDPGTPRVSAGWRVEMPQSDVSGARVAVTRNTQYDEFNDGGWNHLALVYDSFEGEMELYVNGQLEQLVCDTNEDGTPVDSACTDNVSWASNAVGFPASKSLQVGWAKSAGGWGDYWSGEIDDVWAFQGVLDQQQIQQLARGLSGLPSEVPEG